MARRTLWSAIDSDRQREWRPRLAGRTLWSAIDSDRRRWLRASALVTVLLVGLAFSVWLAAVTHVRGSFIAQFLVPLIAIVTFPLVRMVREMRAKQALGAVPLASGMAPVTRSAVHDIFLVAGLEAHPAISMWISDSINAFITRERGKLAIAVSSAFTQLPRDEQRAGIAMLVGRSEVDVNAFAADYRLAESGREDPVPPGEDVALFSAWLDAAVAGDRQGLKILAEPVPMIELLERMSITATSVPELYFPGGDDASFGFLAWPYSDSGKPLAQAWAPTGEMSAFGGLPPEAAAAVAAVIAEEKSFDASSLTGRSALSVGGAEAVRAMRLREVSGAEGAVAGWTSSAARRRRREEREAREARAAAGGATESGDREVDTPDAAGAAAAQAAAPAAATAAATASATATAAAVAAVPAAAAAQSAPEAVAPPRVPVPEAERIHVHCPACGASNVPANRACVSCGARL